MRHVTQEFNTDPIRLMDGVEIMPKGPTYMFGLRQLGYITVAL